MIKHSSTLNVHTETWAYRRPFRIAGRRYESKTSVVVELCDNHKIGRGEAWHLYYRDETLDSVVNDVESLASKIEKGLSREELQQCLPSGGARNALDLALWDLECKLSGKSIWQLTGITPKPIATVYTLGIEDTPEELAQQASIASQYPLLKIKLDGDRPVERIEAIRTVRPEARLIIDANQDWTFEQLVDVAPKLAALKVEMIEQPLPRGHDSDLEAYTSPITLAADESCLDRGELLQASRRYQMINIKLDKTGGLTEALLLVEATKKMGLELMVGNMGGTSLCIAPAFVIGQFCNFVDLDGPLLLKHDRSNAIFYTREMIAVPEAELWG